MIIEKVQQHIIRMEFELNTEEESRIFLSSPLIKEKSAWLYSDDCFEGICAGCNSSQNVWKVYSYADGYVQFCLDMVSKYVESGLLKPNVNGRIKSYDPSVLALKAEEMRSIPWKIKIFCESCKVKSEFRGTSAWRPDSNHFFQGSCVVCQLGKAGGIKNILSEK